jgi:prepilin-type N-terminal cleavage/methylation domain-containing protein
VHANSTTWRLRTLCGQQGFTLIEIAVVMVIVGLLAGGGVSLMRSLTERKARNETMTYLKDVRLALISYAEKTGRLPWADSDSDGSENSGVAGGYLPYWTLQVPPKDAYSRTLRYAVNANLGNNRSSTCSALRTGLTGTPQVVDADGASVPLSTALVIVSAGPMDADGDGNVFDRLATGTHQGDNTDGTPNYLRHPPTTGFDDLALYITGNELYGFVCEFLSVAVNNHSGSTVYVHDANRGVDLGSLTGSASNVYEVVSGIRLELRSGPGGGGAIVNSNPPTPIALAGRGLTITLP